MGRPFSIRTSAALVSVCIAALAAGPAIALQGDGGRLSATVLRVDYLEDETTRISTGRRYRDAVVLGQLFLDDQIHIRSGEVLIRFLGGDELTLTAGDSPYLLARAPQQISFLGNVWRALVESIARDADIAHLSFVSKGEVQAPLQFTAAGLADATACITPGDHALYVQWHGGVAPYAVHLAQKDTGSIELAAASEPRQTFSPNSFEIGSAYAIEIVDAAGNSITGEFAACDVEVPVFGEPEPTGLGDIASAYQSMWLAQEHGAVWSFQALQQLNAHRGGSLDIDALIEVVQYYSDE